MPEWTRWTRTLMKTLSRIIHRLGRLVGNFNTMTEGSIQILYNQIYQMHMATQKKSIQLHLFILKPDSPDSSGDSENRAD